MTLYDCSGHEMYMPIYHTCTVLVGRPNDTNCTYASRHCSLYTGIEDTGMKTFKTRTLEKLCTRNVGMYIMTLVYTT